MVENLRWKKYRITCFLFPCFTYSPISYTVLFNSILVSPLIPFLGETCSSTPCLVAPTRSLIPSAAAASASSSSGPYEPWPLVQARYIHSARAVRYTKCSRMCFFSIMCFVVLPPIWAAKQEATYCLIIFKD